MICLFKRRGFGRQANFHYRHSVAQASARVTLNCALDRHVFIARKQKSRTGSKQSHQNKVNKTKSSKQSHQNKVNCTQAEACATQPAFPQSSICPTPCSLFPAKNIFAQALES